MVAAAVEEVDAIEEPASLQPKPSATREVSLGNQLRGFTSSKIRHLSHLRSEEALETDPRKRI